MSINTEKKAKKTLAEQIKTEQPPIVVMPTYTPPDPWIWTHTGKEFHYFDDFDTDQIDVRDIAASLAKQCRYNGHVAMLYSVADHAVNLVEHVEEAEPHTPPRIRFGLLHHDDSEAYLPDVPGPIKDFLPDYGALERRIMTRIERKFDLPSSKQFYEWVHYYDKNIVRSEAEHFFERKPTWIQRFINLHAEVVCSVTWQAARDRFLKKHDQLIEEMTRSVYL